jgi:hypothetical protein
MFPGKRMTRLRNAQPSVGFAQRLALWVGVAALAAGSVSCSLVIDVEPDCQDPVCSPYRCTTDGIACGVSCRTDAECAAGYSCDATAGVCEFSGCTVITGVERVLLDLPEMVTELAMATLKPDAQPEQMLVAVGNRNLFGYRRFQMTGQPAPDRVDASQRLLVQVPTNPDVRRFSPAVVPYRRAGARDPDRFVFGFVDVSRSPQFPVVGNFIVDPDPVSPASTAVGPGAGRNTVLVGSSVAAAVGRVGFAWIDVLTAESRVYMAEVEPNGERTDARDLVPVSRPGEKPERTTLAPAPDGWILTYDGISGGERQIFVVAIGADGTVRSRSSLLAGRAASYAIDGVASAATADGVVIAWQSGAEPDRALQRVWLSNDIIARMMAGDSVDLRARQVDSGLQVPRRVAVAATPDEYYILSSGTRSGRDGMWLYRFSGEADALFAPVRVAPRTSTAIELFRVSATSAGFAVVWSERESDQRSTVYYSHFFCESPSR